MSEFSQSDVHTGAQLSSRYDGSWSIAGSDSDLVIRRGRVFMSTEKFLVLSSV